MQIGQANILYWEQNNALSKKLKIMGCDICFNIYYMQETQVISSNCGSFDNKNDQNIYKNKCDIC